MSDLRRRERPVRSVRLVHLKHEPDPQDVEKPFWRQRRWQVAAAFLAMVVAAGGAATVTQEDETATAAVDAGPRIGGLGPDGERPQQCRTDDAGQAIPEEAPSDITWWPLNGAQTPRSGSAGPLKTTGPLRWCFAHTPMGAVMAANVIPRQMSGPNWRVVTRQQLMPGFARDYYEAMRESLTTVEDLRTTNSLAGFRVASYSPESAVIQILIRQDTARYASVDYTVDWDGVDWKLRPLTIGELYTNVTPVRSLAGFAIWKEA